MLAAHEGVPVRPLPGGWKPPPPGAIVQDDGPAPVPTADVGAKAAPAPRQVVPAASRPRPAPPRPVGAAQTVDAGGFGMPAQDNAPTASIGHPVPPGNVGGSSRKRHTTILDILSGG
jgi:penicillin-binding protein 1A